MEQVFVYGTLKVGHSNNDLIEHGNFIGKDGILGWEMKDLGPFPAIIKGNKHIIGEVWEINNLEMLDMLEGYPSFYNREEIDTHYGKAWVYYIDTKDNSMLDHTTIQTGEWI